MLYYRTMIVFIILRIYPSMYDIASGASSALYDDWFFKKVWGPPYDDANRRVMV